MTTGQYVPQPQTPQQTIVFTMLLSFFVFLISGPTAQAGLTHKLNALRPYASAEPAPRTQWLTASNAIGWAVTFLMLLTLSDISATAQLAQAMAWLILVSILISLGPAAMNTLGNLTHLSNTNAAGGSTGTSGSPTQGAGAGATGQPG